MYAIAVVIVSNAHALKYALSIGHTTFLLPDVFCTDATDAVQSCVYDIVEPTHVYNRLVKYSAKDTMHLFPFVIRSRYNYWKTVNKFIAEMLQGIVSYANLDRDPEICFTYIIR